MATRYIGIVLHSMFNFQLTNLTNLFQYCKMKLFVALVVLCCALSAHGECHFEYPQFNGGVLDENGYIPGNYVNSYNCYDI